MSNTFKNFYTSFPGEFEDQLDSLLKQYKIENCRPEIRVWKYAGDEILFYVKIAKQNQVPAVVKAFLEVLDERYVGCKETENKLALKGSIWTGQTPFIDRILDGIGDDKLDFIGPSIDCGFRIGKYANHTDITLSVEVVDLCTTCPAFKDDIYYIKSENLKGVLGDFKYPIFILKLPNAEKEIEEECSLREPCGEERLKGYIKAHYEKLLKKYNDKKHPVVSRIDENIEAYLKKKEPLSKEIIASEPKTRPQDEEAKEFA